MPSINRSLFDQNKMFDTRKTDASRHQNINPRKNRISKNSLSMRQTNSQNRIKDTDSLVKISPKKISDEIWQELQKAPTSSRSVETKNLQYETAPCSRVNRLKVNEFKNGMKGSSVYIHANEMTASRTTAPVIMAQAPHSHDPSSTKSVKHKLQNPPRQDHVWQHWHAIFKKDAHVIEIVNPQPESAAGETRFEFFGLNFIHPSMLTAQCPDIHIGNYRVQKIREIPTRVHPPLTQMRERLFEISICQKHSDIKTKIQYQIFETKHSKKLLTAENLLVLVDHQDQHKPIWVTSQTGVARPSAFVLANTIKQEVESKHIKTVEQLQSKIIQYTLQGRQTRGERFLHNFDQLYEIVRFGLIQLDIPTYKGVALEESHSKANLHNYPMRWIPYRKKYPNNPISHNASSNNEVFRKNEFITSFAEITGKLRGAIFI